MSETSTEAKQYIKKATDLRNEGRIEEALLSARKATTLASEDANAWWQLALCQELKEGHAAAIKALEKTVEFAGHFAEGWCHLGLAYKKTSMLDKAIECYERALEEDHLHAPTLKLLDQALQERDVTQDKNRRLKILASLHELGELDSNTSFTYALMLTEQKNYLASIKIYELSIQLSYNPIGSYNNLGYNYEKLGRDLDAIDAYRKAVSLDESYELAISNIERILPPLLSLRERALKKSPYLEQLNWYKHYINPFELLGIAEPSEVYGNAKVLQKYKQALYREIDLNFHFHLSFLIFDFLVDLKYQKLMLSASLNHYHLL
jgi:tetratricopeptide (TPR) repeat protein